VDVARDVRGGDHALTRPRLRTGGPALLGRWEAHRASGVTS
jgi:hypothetical protein